MNKMKNIRNPAMDLIRCVALFCVIAVHFFLNSGFYDIPVSGPFMYCMTLLRTSFMVCVPLFLLLSGYLSRFKKFTPNYYKKITKILVIYVIASVLCILYRNIEGSEPLSPVLAVLGILDFSALSYSWYIEMYIGLFLLIPFLNAAYNGLECKKAKQALILSLLFLTALPDVVNIWRILDLYWWTQPSYNPAYYELMPNWWITIYPITYYYIGCYLNEYPLKLKRSYNLLLLILVIFAAGSFSFYRSYNANFVSGAWQSYSSVITVAQTVLLFTLLANVNLDGLSNTAKKWLSRLSGWTLGAYLVSWVIDQVYYQILDTIQPSFEGKFRYFLIIVPAIYISSLGISALLNIGYDVTANFLQRFRRNKTVSR